MSSTTRREESSEGKDLPGSITRHGRIILNVGGTTFQTTVATLTEGSSYFSAMLRGCWGDVVLDADGMHSCFIDADPGTFTHILTYLRTGRMPLFWLPTGGFDLSLYSRVLDQAHFFCIEPLRTWIEKRNYEKAVTLTDFVELRDDDEAKNWKGDLKNISQRYGNSKVDVHHEWAKEKKYLCPRGIPVHYGKPEACGRACEQAKGDDPDEYHTWDYCRFVIETQTTEFNHKALEPEVEPGIEPED